MIYNIPKSCKKQVLLSKEEGIFFDFFGLSPFYVTFFLKQKFLRGVQGGSFFKKRPPGRRRQERLHF
jgi:hypothetical protein